MPCRRRRARCRSLSRPARRVAVVARASVETERSAPTLTTDGESKSQEANCKRERRERQEESQRRCYLRQPRAAQKRVAHPFDREGHRVVLGDAAQPARKEAEREVHA